MPTLLASTQVRCPFDNITQLKIYVSSGGELTYKYGSLNGQPHALSNMQMSEPLPHHINQVEESPLRFHIMCNILSGVMRPVVNSWNDFS